MIKSYRLFLLTIMSAFLVSVAFAAKPSENRHLEILPHEQESSIRLDNMRVSKETGVPLALYRLDYAVDADTPENMARQYLQENAGLLQIRSDLSDLKVFAVRETPGGFHVRFQQYLKNYPVYQSTIVVNIDRKNRINFVMNSYKPNLQPAENAPAVTAFQARTLAMEYLNIQGALQYENQSTVVYYQKERTRLAHQITLVPADDIFGDWEILVDAVSGELIRVADRACYGGRARVFEPDPLTRARALYQIGGPFGDNGDNDTDSLVAQIVWRTLPDLTYSGNQYHLEGPYAKIEDFEAPYKGLFSQPDSVWNFTRFPDAFEAANVYYHLDRSMRYINDTLGFALMPYQYTTGVQFDPHGLNGADNSHYISSTGRIAWGEGGVDDSEDPDVILHELGHGLHDWVTFGGLSQVTGSVRGAEITGPLPITAVPVSGLPPILSITGYSSGTATTNSGPAGLPIIPPPIRVVWWDKSILTARSGPRP